MHKVCRYWLSHPVFDPGFFMATPVIVSCKKALAWWRQYTSIISNIYESKFYIVIKSILIPLYSIRSSLLKLSPKKLRFLSMCLFRFILKVYRKARITEMREDVEVPIKFRMTDTNPPEYWKRGLGLTTYRRMQTTGLSSRGLVDKMKCMGLVGSWYAL